MKAKKKPRSVGVIDRRPLEFWNPVPVAQSMKASDALTRAAALVDGDRETTHGNKAKSFQHVAEMWTAFLGHPVTPEQVCICMTLLKIGRAAHGTPNEDHYTDAAGYVAIAGELRLKGTFQ